MMRRADVFVYHAITSPEDGDAEGLPNVILEAMTVGLPVVATRHAGIPEVVCKRASGLLTEEGDVTSMADALSMFAASPDMRIRMGRQGWQRAREHFSREAYRAALLSLLGLAGHAGVVSA